MVYCIGEALIDMLPDNKTEKSFCRYAGGSPANVAACVALLGAQSSLISKVGADENGRFIVSELKKYGVDTTKVFFTKNKKTGIVYFGANTDNMNEICAQRKESADRFLTEQQIKAHWFNANDILYYSSICLVEAPVLKAQKRAIEYISKAKGRLLFDINYRPKLWHHKEEFLMKVWEYIEYADYLKLSEFDFVEIMNNQDYDKGVKNFFETASRLKMIIITKGSKGACLYLKGGYKIEIDALKVKTVDTLGAGDCFIGCFLYFLHKFGTPNKEQLQDILVFCVAAAALHVTKKGAINSLPTLQEIEILIKNVKSNTKITRKRNL